LNSHCDVLDFGLIGGIVVTEDEQEFYLLHCFEKVMHRDKIVLIIGSEETLGRIEQIELILYFYKSGFVAF
jgi:hypothetical protein